MHFSERNPQVHVSENTGGDEIQGGGQTQNPLQDHKLMTAFQVLINWSQQVFVSLGFLGFPLGFPLLHHPF